MAEWKTCRERCYLEELASADGKMKVYRQKASRPPVESILEQAEAARSELEEEFGEGAFASLEYTLQTHNSCLGAYYIWDTGQVNIDLPVERAPLLSDVLAVSYSRYLIPKAEAARLHELYLREACGEALEAKDDDTVQNLMNRANAEWERSYGLRSASVLRELLRHESAHSLEKNIRPPQSLDELRRIYISPKEFTDHAVNAILREGFATLVGYEYEQIIPPALGEVFRERLQKMFRRAETIDYEKLTPTAVIWKRLKRFLARAITGKATVPSATYGSYISGLDPCVLDFAGEYLAGTIFRAYGKEGVRKCVTELNQKDILAWHLYACAASGMTPLFDLSEYPYFEE